MSRVHLGMTRPIKQFGKYYTKLLNLIEEIEQFPPTNDLEKLLYISRLKDRFNDALIQLNNIKNTQIDYLKESGE